jgi:hypothetical protein
MNLNWQPGHMEKTRELLKTKLKIVEIVITRNDKKYSMDSNSN